MPNMSDITSRCPLSSVKTKVFLVGVGGASCSGKTTLAKQLHRILPDSFIIHQDDFAPPQELIPVHPVHKVQDWDAAETAIDWPRFIRFLRDVKAMGSIPTDHRSHDHLNTLKKIDIDDDVENKWITEFKRLKQTKAEAGENIVWGLVDGFLMYWHPDVIDQLDASFMLRVPHDILKTRRDERQVYHTAVQFNTEGTVWRDPPGYWEHIVYPAYVEAHKGVFMNDDVENGPPGNKVRKLILLEPSKMPFAFMVEQCCAELKDVVEPSPNTYLD